MSGFRLIAVIFVLCSASTKVLSGQFLTVRSKSLDGLQENAAYLSQLAGDTQFGADMEKLAVAAVPAALDAGRDWYLYLLLPPAPGDDPTIVVRCPIHNKSNFIDYLRTFHGRTTPTTDNRYSIATAGLPFSHLLITHDFAFLSTRPLTNDDDVLSEPHPEGKKTEKNVITVSFDLDAIPQEFLEAWLQRAANALREVAQEARGIDSLLLDVSIPQVIQDTRAAWSQTSRITLELDLSLPLSQVSLEFHAMPKLPTESDKSEEVVKRESMFACLVEDSMFCALLRGDSVSDEDPSFREDLAQLGAFGQFLLNPPDKRLQPFIQRMIQIASNEHQMDLVVALRSTDREGPTWLIGHHGSSWNSVERLVRDIMRDVPVDQLESAGIDFAKHGNHSIHRVRGMPFAEYTFVAFGQDLVLFGIGDGGLEVIKNALDGLERSSPRQVIPFQLKYAPAMHLRARLKHESEHSKLPSDRARAATRLSRISAAAKWEKEANILLRAFDDTGARIHINADTRLLKLLEPLVEEVP